MLAVFFRSYHGRIQQANEQLVVTEMCPLRFHVES